MALEPLWTVKARPDVLNMGTFSLRLRFGMWRLMVFWDYFAVFFFHEHQILGAGLKARGLVGFDS